MSTRGVIFILLVISVFLASCKRQTDKFEGLAFNIKPIHFLKKNELQLPKTFILGICENSKEDDEAGILIPNSFLNSSSISQTIACDSAKAYVECRFKVTDTVGGAFLRFKCANGAYSCCITFDKFTANPIESILIPYYMKHKETVVYCMSFRTTGNEDQSHVIRYYDLTKQTHILHPDQCVALRDEYFLIDSTGHFIFQ